MNIGAYDEADRNMNDAETIPTKQPGEVGLVHWEDFHCTEPFDFEHGGRLSEFNIRYETYGRLNREASNAILICHALSGDHHCAGVHSLNDRKAGWWNNFIGPGKAVDTDRYFVICSNCLGGCQGSTGPASINPATGQTYSCDFPLLTIRDLVRAQRRLLAHLRVERLYAAIGGSMGGMQVLQWAIDYPDRVDRIIAMATTARQNAQAIAFNEVGRCAIVQDPEWKNGRYQSDQGPRLGLSMARMMAHITYLSDKGLDEKFGRARKKAGLRPQFIESVFEVGEYLRYQGQSFLNRFDANTYLYLTQALDLFDLYGEHGNLEETFQPIQAKTLAIGFTSDWLFPPSQNRDLVHALLRAGKHASYAQLDMDLGHDSFLVEAPALYYLVSAFLDT